MKNKIGLLMLTILATSILVIFPVPAIVHGDGQAGTTLSANVTATGYWTKTFTWTIDKSVTPEAWDLFQGDSGTSKYTITVTKDSGTDKYGVNGTVTVNNGGDRATEGLKIVVQVEYKTGSGQFQPLPGASQTIIPSEQIPAGGSRSYDYSIEFTPVTGANYRVAAKVTITNHSGHLGEEWGPEPKADFSIPSTPTMINDVIHVDDTNGHSWKFDSSGSVTYEKTFTCADEGVNTATIRETGQSASATVTVNCYRLDVYKTAETSFKRTYTWTIDKAGNATELTLKPGETAVINYTVTLVASYEDSDWNVMGKIAIYNPAPIPANIIGVADMVSPKIAATIDFGVTFPYTLNPGQWLNGTYKASLPNASSRVNTVTVTLQNYNYRWDRTKTETVTTNFTATADVVFTEPTTLVDEQVDVKDDYCEPLGSVSYEDAPKVFTYTRIVGPYEEAGTYWVNNTASFTTCDTGTTGSDKWSVKVTVESSLPSQAIISGVKFYDANLNGVYDLYDPEEAPLAGWNITLYKLDETQEWVLYGSTLTGEDGAYEFVVSEAGTYKIVEIMPLDGTWIQTAPAAGYYEIVVDGGTYTGYDFGNVLLVQGTGGKTLGFWSNKNGQALIDASDVTALNGLNLYRPNGWNYPPFSENLVTAKTQIRTYLLSANAKDMRWMLSAQLIATVLNVRHGFLSGSTTVHVDSSSYVPTGFITIDEIIENANGALSGGDRGAQGYWKDLLDGLNNNRLLFVSPSPP
ncbi:MAG: hypothetical protein QXK78_07005 [Candidatus Bathyarchaeia archaeon]